MPSPELGVGHAAARVHHASRLIAPRRQYNFCGVNKCIGSYRSPWRGFRCTAYGKVPRRHNRPGARSGFCQSRARETSGSRRGRRAAHGTFARNDVDRYGGDIWQRPLRRIDRPRDCRSARPRVPGFQSVAQSRGGKWHRACLRGKPRPSRH